MLFHAWRTTMQGDPVGPHVIAGAQLNHEVTATAAARAGRWFLGFRYRLGMGVKIAQGSNPELIGTKGERQ